MFSGLTNQVTSWMGNVKGDQEEKVPTPTDDNNTLLSPDKKDGRYVLSIDLIFIDFNVNV